MNEGRYKTLSFTRARARAASVTFGLALLALVAAPFVLFGAAPAQGRWSAALGALSSPDAKERAAAQTQLASAGAEALPELLGWMDSTRRLMVAAEVGRAMGPAAVPGLVALLRNPELGSRAGDLLSAVARPELVGELPGVLACVKDSEVRDVCGRALVLLMGPKGRAYRPQLEEALKDSAPAVRAYAAGALGQLGLKGGAAVPALTAALSDGESSVRWSAAVALGKIGKKAAGAVPALEAAAQDGDGQVRAMAAQALRKIRG